MLDWARISSYLAKEEGNSKEVCESINAIVTAIIASGKLSSIIFCAYCIHREAS
jgi:hypothetical protein